MDTALKFITLIIMVAIFSITQGYVLSVTWGWFIVPIFGVPTLGMGYAMGLFLVLDQFRKMKKGNGSLDDDEFMKTLGGFVYRMGELVFILSLAWIVKSFLI